MHAGLQYYMYFLMWVLVKILCNLLIYLKALLGKGVGHQSHLLLQMQFCCYSL